jgi:hypothetical protein
MVADQKHHELERGGEKEKWRETEKRASRTVPFWNCSILELLP